MIQIADLWFSRDPRAWEDALDRYWSFVRPENLALERSLDTLDLERLRELDAQGWYHFLKDEYFPWKYTDPRWLKTTRRQLRRYEAEDRLNDLDRIRSRLLALDTDDVEWGLEVAKKIHGLGIAGASGLLALIYPQKFGTVDQFVVKALREVNGLPEAAELAQMKPEGIKDHPNRESQTARKPTRIPGFLAKSITCSGQIIAIDQSLPNSSRTTIYSSLFRGVAPCAASPHTRAKSAPP